jgi:SAM-dependent methyltransferase
VATIESADAAREWLGGLPAQRAAYAVVTDAAVAARLEKEYRRVGGSDGATAFALREVVPAPDRAGRDGLPLPPPNMVQLVAGISTPHRFYQRFVDGGAATARRIGEMLPVFAELGSVLDFGCGCGRVMRHWHDVRGPRLHGTDYNPFLVEWCAANLPFARFSVNGLEPGLEFGDGEFDLVYSYSVFTHLPEEMQTKWLAELVRVTAPGGHLWLTFHGAYAAGALDPADRARFAAGELVVVLPRGEEDYGTNACAVYHPERFVRDELAAALDVVGHVAGDETFIQDAYLLKKRA